MRILQINRNDVIDGGADRVFLNTIEGLKQFSSPMSKGDKGGYVSTDERFNSLTVEQFSRLSAGVRIEDPKSLSFFGKIKHVRNYLYNKKVANELEEKIKDFKPDIAHLHLIFGTLSLSVLRILKKHNVPIVMTVHDYRLICPVNAMLDRHGKVCEQCQGKKYYKCLTRRCSEGNIFYSAIAMVEAYIRRYFIKPLKLIDHFIFVSQFARNKHIEFIPQYQQKSSHLYNMANGDVKPEFTRGDYLLYFGRLSQEKGLVTLIDAALVTGYELRVAGSGPLEELLVKRTRNPKPETCNIKFLGFKNKSELTDLIRNSQFVVVPSEWYENNPMTIVEAFSLGKPVIGANIGGIPELVNEETGFLFEAGNVDSLREAIIKTINLKTNDYIKMSKVCREFALNQFNQENHLSHLIDIYQKLVS